MTNNGFNTVLLDDGTEMDIYAAFPQIPGSYPGLIVLQEAFGVNAHIRNVCEKLCREGYAVVAPDLFHRTAHRIEVPYSDFSVAMPHYQAITREGAKADLWGAYEFLQGKDAVIKDMAGAVGYCLGGRVAFYANALLPLKAAVSYYGGAVEQLADEAPNLHGDQLFFWGGKDSHITEDKRNIIIRAVEEAGKNYTNVLISYAGHASSCDDRLTSYHPLAAAEAWQHTLAFLGNRLKG